MSNDSPPREETTNGSISSEDTTVLPTKPPSSKRLSNLLKFLELVAKIGPLIAAIWALYVYVSFTRQQNELALQTAKVQLERSRIESRLDITRKAALGVSTQPRLGIELLSLGDVGHGLARYLVVWEVGIGNFGNREVNIEKNEAELYVGSERSWTSKTPAILEFNHPSSNGAIDWHSALKRGFSVTDLYGAAIGPMSPGDKRVSEISAIVSGRPGMWIFALARIGIRAGEDTSESKEWAYEVLPRRNRDKAGRNSATAPTASSP